MKKILFALPLVILATGCSASTQPDTVGLAYNDGPFSPRTFDECIQPSTRKAQGPADVAFFYPVNQRTDRFTGGDGSDFGPVNVADKDGFPISFPGALAFTMVTECETLRTFHEKIGNRNKAYFDESGQTSEGWVPYVLDPIIHDGLKQALANAASDYTWREMYSDPKVRQEMQTKVNETVGAAIDAKTEGNTSFFTGYSTQLQVPNLPDELRAALVAEQTKVAEANSKRAEADAQIAQAESETRLAQERAQQKAAELAGYPSLEAYLQEQAIEKGLNPFQPTYIVSGTQP